MQDAKVNNILTASIFQVGDVHGINTKSKAFALQRTYPIFDSSEANVDEYPIFSYKEPPLVLSHPIHVRTQNICPYIYVNHIHITSAAAASVLQLGNSESIYSNSKVRHVRQIIDGYTYPNNGK